MSCVTVADNHTLMAGRNGTFQFIGQSLYGVLGWDRFRLYDKEMGAAVTATGREVIDYTDEVVANEGYEVVYGDTDSVMLQLGNVGPDDVEGDVEITDEMREKHPEMDDDVLELIATTIESVRTGGDDYDSYDEFAMDGLTAVRNTDSRSSSRSSTGGSSRRARRNVTPGTSSGRKERTWTISTSRASSTSAPISRLSPLGSSRRSSTAFIRGETQSPSRSRRDVVEDYQDGTVNCDDGYSRWHREETRQLRHRHCAGPGREVRQHASGNELPERVEAQATVSRPVHSYFFQRIEEEEGLDPQRDTLYGEFRRDPDVICFEYADQVPNDFASIGTRCSTRRWRAHRAHSGAHWHVVGRGQIRPEQTGLGSFM